MTLIDYSAYTFGFNYQLGSISSFVGGNQAVEALTDVHQYCGAIRLYSYCNVLLIVLFFFLVYVMYYSGSYATYLGKLGGIATAF